MPPKKSEITLAQLKRLVRAHNVLSKLSVPKGIDREGLIEWIQDNKFMVDREAKAIKEKPGRSSGKRGVGVIDLAKADRVLPKPVKKTAADKAAAKIKKRQSVVKSILVDPDILKDPEVMKLHKGSVGEKVVPVEKKNKETGAQVNERVLKQYGFTTGREFDSDIKQLRAGRTVDLVKDKKSRQAILAVMKKVYDEKKPYGLFSVEPSTRWVSKTVGNEINNLDRTFGDLVDQILGRDGSEKQKAFLAKHKELNK